MSDKALVSVIVPLFNTVRFIADAIESILGQTYENWEILLVDDGSRDGSTEVAVRYAKQHSEKVHYLEHEGHENRGASAARNLGLRHAKGEYIAFLDSDDVYLPEKLQEQVPILNSHPEIGMVYSNTLYWNSWTGNPEDLRRDYEPDLGVPVNTLFQPPALFIPFFLRCDVITPCTCSLLVRRETIQRIAMFEESFRYIYTDQALYAKLCLATPVFVASGTWDKYRQHPDSSCHIVEKTGQQHSARLFFLDWLKVYLLEKGLGNVEIWNALEAELEKTRAACGKDPPRAE